jgi:tetratricopeptide (TPR) repeat protein
MKRLVFLAVLLLAPPVRAESFKAWAARASREEREKHDDIALQSYSNALSSWKDTDGKPPKAKVLCSRAALRDRHGDEAGALADYSDCLALDKKNAKAFHRRGQLRFKAGKTKLAIDDFYKAVALDIGFAQAYADRAQAYEMQGDREFAGEDYRRACGLGLKASCAKAKEFKSARTGAATKGKPTKAKTEGAPGAKTEASPAAGTDAASPKQAPAAAKPAKRPARRAAYIPRFSDCIDSLQACTDSGDSFGTCVGRAPACEKKTVKGCCPRACLEDYRKSVNHGASEASAYRDVFAPDAACAAPPKIGGDDD